MTIVEAILDAGFKFDARYGLTPTRYNSKCTLGVAVLCAMRE